MQWNFVGPKPVVNEVPEFGGVALGGALTSVNGRVTAIATDPTTPRRIFIGTAGGGVWMSSDAGESFVSIFDSEPSLAIGALAIDPTTIPVTIYVGTGEADNSGDSYYGQGLFVSSDLGRSWSQITAAGAFERGSFARIAIDTSRAPVHIFVALSYGSSADRADAGWVESDLFNNGLWRSTDGGASWTHLTFASQAACPSFGGYCPAEDVVIDPDAPQNVYAAIYQYGAIRSSDGGNTWASAGFPGVNRSSVGRISIAARNGTVYASVGAKDGIEYVGFFKSTDRGRTWRPIQTPSASLSGVILDGNSSANYSQADFDQALAIDPSDSTGATAIFGAVGVYRTTDSGTTWTFLNRNGGAHEAQHAIAIDPFSDRIFAGNDGGLYAYDTSAAVWTALNSGFSAAQIQSLGPHPTNDTVLLAGLADNGAIRYDDIAVPSTAFSAVDAGDSGAAIFDRIQPSFAYRTSATDSEGPTLARSVDGGIVSDPIAPTASVRSAMSTAGDFGAAYFPPLAADPNHAGVVLFGAHYVYISTDAMLTWSRQSTQDLSGGCVSGSCAIQDLEFAPSDSTVAWSLSSQSFETSPATPFRVFVTTEANASVNANHPNGAPWTDVTDALPFSTADTQATSIAVSPFDPAVAYLGVSGSKAATTIGHVFSTRDFGATWTEADGNPSGSFTPPATALPDVPVLRLLVDRTDASGRTLLAGTDIGVFRSTDDGATWASFSLGAIPAVPVFDLQQNLNGTIFAGTFGRGIFELFETSAIPTPTPVPTPTWRLPIPKVITANKRGGR